MLDLQPFLNVSLVPPNLLSGQVLSPNCQVFNVQPFNFGISDDSTVPLNCSLVDSENIFQPTTPFSQFNGVQANGEWSLILNSAEGGSIYTFTIDYCITVADTSTCSYAYDIARSNLNIPRYRYDSSTGTAYYTKIIRNNRGEQLYVTISRQAI